MLFGLALRFVVRLEDALRLVLVACLEVRLLTADFVFQVEDTPRYVNSSVSFGVDGSTGTRAILAIVSLNPGRFPNGFFSCLIREYDQGDELLACFGAAGAVMAFYFFQVIEATYNSRGSDTRNGSRRRR